MLCKASFCNFMILLVIIWDMFFLPQARYFAGSLGRYPSTDIVVVRENTEGMYTAEECWEGAPGQMFLWKNALLMA